MIRAILTVGLVGILMFVTRGTLLSGQQNTGVVTGVVKVDSIPDMVTVDVDTDQAVCGTTVEDQTILVAPSGGVANAVILVNGLEWIADPPAPVIKNEGCFFVPRVQVAKTRSQLEITSVDETLHSTHAYDDRQRTMFNVAIPFPGLTIKRPLRRPGVVRIECDSHAWMRGWIYITSDVGAVTNTEGSFEIPEVPIGTYELTVWHERYEGQIQTVTVTAGGTTEVNFTLR